MNHLSRRQLLGAAGAITLGTWGLAACGSGDSKEGGADLAGNRDGAMENFKAGDQFKAAGALSFSTMYLNNQAYSLNEKWLFWEELTKRTGVSLKLQSVPGSDYNQKRSVVVSSGNAPFLIPKTYHPDETAFVPGGAVIPVSDYTDLMPNYTEKIKKWGLEKNLDQWRQSDGRYYLLPGVHENAWQDYTFAIRTDVLQQLGVPTPKTWDDVYTVLKEIKKAYPKSFPLSDRFNQPTPGGNLLNLLAQAHGTSGGWQYNPATWDPTQDKFVYPGLSDGYRQVVEYLNKLFKEGLLDPETFTQTDDVARQKFANSQSFMISTNAQFLDIQYRPDLAGTNPKAKIAKIPVPIGPMGAIIDATTRLENGMMISKQARQSKNFVAMMQFVDWLWYSDAGQEFSKWGVEGTTFTKDAAGNYQPAPDIKFLQLNPSGTKDLRKDYGFGNGVFAYGGSTKLLESTFSEEEKEFQKEMNSRKLTELAPPAPLSDVEREQVTLWEAPLKDQLFSQTLKFILGQRPLSEWDAFTGELKSAHAQEWADITNKARDRYAKEHG
jgi:putative aldouronate transport system substrate-binding protein